MAWPTFCPHPMNTKCVLPGNGAMNSSKDYSLFHNACKNAESLVHKCKMTGCLGALEIELLFLYIILPSRVCRANEGAKLLGERCGS